jgi:hypothetical protein
MKSVGHILRREHERLRRYVKSAEPPRYGGPHRSADLQEAIERFKATHALGMAGRENSA